MNFRKIERFKNMGKSKEANTSIGKMKEKTCNGKKIFNGEIEIWKILVNNRNCKFET
jgi:hypothetical protein